MDVDEQLAQLEVGLGKVIYNFATLEHQTKSFVGGLLTDDQRLWRAIFGDLNLSLVLGRARAVAAIVLEAEPDLIERVDAWVIAAGDLAVRRNGLIHGTFSIDTENAALWLNITRIRKGREDTNAMREMPAEAVTALAQEISTHAYALLTLMKDIGARGYGSWRIITG